MDNGLKHSCITGRTKKYLDDNNLSMLGSIFTQVHQLKGLLYHPKNGHKERACMRSLAQLRDPVPPVSRRGSFPKVKDQGANPHPATADYGNAVANLTAINIPVCA
ncbi:hypothetical protein J6590_046413 [Homalodisca vitripennis]|nr:hypothetical protein J6590_046413 [Homalodisca vitripennis]